MPKKAGIGGSDALELFLDTICNAFGGIIFISLLVCVMLQLSGRFVRAPKDPAEQKARQQRLKEVQARIARLQSVVDAQAKLLKAMTPGADPGRYRRYLVLVDEKTRLEDKSKALHGELQGILIKVDEAEGRRLELQERRGELAEQEEKLNEELKKLRKRRGMQLSVPTAGATKKKPVAVMVCGERIAFVKKYGPNGLPIAMNDDHIVVRDDPARRAKTVELKPGGGIPVRVLPAAEENWEEREKALAELAGQVAPELQNLTPAPQNGRGEEQCHYVVLYVWPDSFQQAGLLRDILINKGFNYSLILMKQTERLHISAEAGPAPPPL